MNIFGLKWGKRRTKRCKEPLVIDENFDEVVAMEELKQRIEERKRREEEIKNLELAIDLAMQANGNEEAMNDVCDWIKRMGLVEGYN